MSDQGANKINSISIAQAIFSPLSAIFESQVQASRSFLNYIMSMGFMHIHTQDEINNIKDEKKRRETPEVGISSATGLQPADPNSLQGMSEGAFNALYEKAIEHEHIHRHRKGEKLDDGINVDELMHKHEDMYYMYFPIEGPDNKPIRIKMPALALLPVKPLAVEEASIKFSMSLESEYSKSESGSARAKKRPWMSIDPIEMQGAISSKTQDTASIEIEIKVSAMPVPAGLDAILTTLSNNVTHSNT